MSTNADSTSLSEGPDETTCTTESPTPLADEAAQLVDDLRLAFGKHHARAVHAKGVILEGTFAPSDAARALSKAAVFAGSTIPVTIRFSNFTGIPDIPDNVKDADPRGMAVKLQAGGTENLDIVSHSFNGFPVPTAREFGVLLRCIASSGPGTPKPTPLDRYLEGHPAAQQFLTTQKPPPVSYATTAYYGVNSVVFVSKMNKRCAVRYRFIPAAGEHYLDDASRDSMDPNYLSKEIAKRAAEAPIRFDWHAQLAAPGDKIEDPSIAWPECRATVNLGTISIERFLTDQSANRSLLFLPGMLPSGIEVADPMFAVREVAYPISYGERQ